LRRPPSNDIYWLRDRDLELIGPYSAADEEILIAKCDYKRSGKMFDEGWSQSRIDKVNSCTFDVWYEHYFEQQLDFVFKLKRGWRPWREK
jgi:hypothetical protein